MSSLNKYKSQKAAQNPDHLTYQLIAVDLDGTLLDSSGQPAPGVEEAIRAARDCGLRIALISGRGLLGALPMVKRFNLEGLFVASGGAIIAEAPHGNLIDHRPISLRSANKLARLGHAEHLVVYFEHPEWLLSEADGEKLENETHAFGYRLTVVNDLARAAPSAPSKVTMFGDPDRLAHLIELLNNQNSSFNYFQTLPQYLDIYGKNVNKGSALIRLSRYLGIPLRRVIAIGDYYNDLDMFRVAGMSVAMGNAPLEVRQAAQRVAPGNDEGGAAWAIMSAMSGS